MPIALFWVILARVWPGWRSALRIVQPATVLRWHRQAFRYYWRWKNRLRGRPRLDPEIRALIRRMCRANPLWGAPRIHGELLKLGIRDLRGHGLKLYDPATRTAFSELADLPCQPMRKSRRIARNTVCRTQCRDVDQPDHLRDRGLELTVEQKLILEPPAVAPGGR